MNDQQALAVIATIVDTALDNAGGDENEALALLATAMHVVATRNLSRTDAAAVLRGIADSIKDTARRVEHRPARQPTETV